MISLTVMFTKIFLLLIFTPPLFAQNSIIAQIQKVQPSIVGIKAENSGWFKNPKQTAVARDPKTGRILLKRDVARASYQRYGAGVVIHESGVVVTNAHNIHRADHVKVVLNNSREVSAQLIRFVSDLDVALLKIAPPFALTAIPLADSDQLKLGDEIITVGNSSLLKQTVSGGRIKGLGTSRRSPNGTMRKTELIQTTINLYQGDSGGPLFDQRGYLVGLMTASETAADHSSFAIPANNIKKYLLEYLNQNDIVKP